MDGSGERRDVGNADWVEAKRAFADVISPDTSVDVLVPTAWDRLVRVHREKTAEVGHDRLERVRAMYRDSERGRADERFGYTDAERQFCCDFDVRARMWEEDQQLLVDNFSDMRRCDCCMELRPPWVAGEDHVELQLVALALSQA